MTTIWWVAAFAALVLVVGGALALLESWWSEPADEPDREMLDW